MSDTVKVLVREGHTVHVTDLDSEDSKKSKDRIEVARTSADGEFLIPTKEYEELGPDGFNAVVKATPAEKAKPEAAVTPAPKSPV